MVPAGQLIKIFYWLKPMPKQSSLVDTPQYLRVSLVLAPGCTCGCSCHPLPPWSEYVVFLPWIETENHDSLHWGPHGVFTLSSPILHDDPVTLPTLLHQRLCLCWAHSSIPFHLPQARPAWCGRFFCYVLLLLVNE